jgi:hypothetical protein
MGYHLHRTIRSLEEAQDTLQKLSVQVKSRPGGELNMLIGYSLEIILDDIEELRRVDIPDETIAAIAENTAPRFERLMKDLRTAGEKQTLSPLFSRAACAKAARQLSHIQEAINEARFERETLHAHEDEEAAPYLIAKGWDESEPVEPARSKLYLVRNR